MISSSKSSRESQERQTGSEGARAREKGGEREGARDSQERERLKRDDRQAERERAKAKNRERERPPRRKNCDKLMTSVKRAMTSHAVHGKRTIMTSFVHVMTSPELLLKPQLPVINLLFTDVTSYDHLRAFLPATFRLHEVAHPRNR